MDSRLLKFFEKLPPELKPVFLEFYELLEKEFGERLTREEFREFYREFLEHRNRFEALAERTEENFRRVWEAIERLTQRVDQLTERLDRLTERVDQLTERLNRLTERVDQLTERLDRLTERVDQLTEQVEKLTRSLSRTREEVGGLARTMAYALENEAYRYLPSFLREHFGLEVLDRFVRTYLNGEEVDIFGKVRRDGQEIYLVGEAVLKLDDREKLRSVWRKVEIVKEEFGGEVLPVIVTHMAHPEILERARKAGILVVQSFEWQA